LGNFEKKKRLLGIESQKTPINRNCYTLQILSTVTVVVGATAWSAVSTVTAAIVTAMSTAIVAGRIYSSRIMVNVQRVCVYMQGIVVNVQRIVVNVQGIVLVQGITHEQAVTVVVASAIATF
jgi:hypothetical protein